MWAYKNVELLAIALHVYISKACDQARFTISKVAADWHELMTPHRTMWPSVDRISEKYGKRRSMQTYHSSN